jgi:type II secretory pathway component GspD/PulD (secretin)
VSAIRPIYHPKTTRLEIISDRSLSIKQVKLSKGGVLRIDAFNATTSLPDSIAIDSGILRGAAFETEENELMIYVYLTEPVIYEMESMDRGLVVVFQNPVLEQLISLNVNNESLSTILLMLFTQYGANIIAGSEVSGNVTAHLVDVPLRSALDEILRAEEYGYIKEGELIRVMTLSKLESEKAKRATPPPKSVAATEMISKVIELKYTNVSDIKQVIQGLVGTDGTLLIDERTNSVIIISSPQTIEKIEGILKQLDKEIDGEEAVFVRPLSGDVTQPEQIEVVVPEIVKQVFKLQYMEPETASAILQPLLSERGSIDIVAKQDKGRAGGGAGGSGAGAEMQLGVGVGQGGYIVVSDIEEVVKRIEEEIAIYDVPVPQIEIEAYIVEGALSNDNELGIDWTSVNKGEDIEFGFSGEYGAVLSKGIITAERFMGILNALSTRSDLRVLSNPRITTLENQPAVFHSGDKIPYNRIVIQDGIQQTDTVFEDVGIVLAVTPQVKANEMISLLLSTSVSSESGFTPSGQPRISTRTTQSQVLVKSGDTVAIAGLISEKASTMVSKVPILGDIPLIGRIFSTEREVKQRSEVTIFITPQIR